MGKEHFTITEKHPYHGVNDTEAYSPICPKCQNERMYSISRGELVDAFERAVRDHQREGFVGDDGTLAARLDRARRALLDALGVSS